MMSDGRGWSRMVADDRGWPRMVVDDRGWSWMAAVIIKVILTFMTKALEN